MFSIYQYCFSDSNVVGFDSGKKIVIVWNVTVVDGGSERKKNLN